MGIKIKETVERECCLLGKDLKVYHGTVKTGSVAKDTDFRFCVHCGQLWLWVRPENALTNMDEELVRVTPDF